MNRRKAVTLLAGFTGATALASANASAQSGTDDTNTAWVVRVLEEMDQIKPGMTRADLLAIFKTEGGLWTRLQRTYVSRHCPYFKVDVTFQAVGRPDRDARGAVTLAEDGRDRIVTISRPYLQFSHMD